MPSRSLTARDNPRRTRRSFKWNRLSAWRHALLARLVLAGFVAFPCTAVAGTMAKDPQGFHNIPWGAKLAELPSLQLAEPGERITGFEFKGGPPRFGEATVDSVRLSAIEGKFARAAIHYKGKKTHDLIMSYMESQFGPIDRTPGSMMRGLNQQYNWRGTETEINMIYQSMGERGVIFFESRVLAPRFNDTLSETAY
jgi:hypothetical protein